MNYGESNTDKVLAESGYRFDSDFGLIKIEVDPNLAPGMAYFKNETHCPIPLLFGGPREEETDIL